MTAVLDILSCHARRWVSNNAQMNPSLNSLLNGMRVGDFFNSFVPLRFQLRVNLVVPPVYF